MEIPVVDGDPGVLALLRQVGVARAIAREQLVPLRGVKGRASVLEGPFPEHLPSERQGAYGSCSSHITVR
eukprot:5249268-Lingulodinium_polyedra.AAC.1